MVARSSLKSPSSRALRPSSLQAAWSRFGRLPWRRLVQPAAALADGFEVGPLLATDIARYATQLQGFPHTKEVYFPKGVMLKEGAQCATRNAVPEGNEPQL